MLLSSVCQAVCLALEKVDHSAYSLITHTHRAVALRFTRLRGKKTSMTAALNASRRARHDEQPERRRDMKHDSLQSSYLKPFCLPAITRRTRAVPMLHNRRLQVQQQQQHDEQCEQWVKQLPCKSEDRQYSKILESNESTELFRA